MPTPATLALLAFKLACVPLLIALVSVAGQRFGPRVAGLLAGFPIVAGPIFVILAVEHGPAFGARAAVGTLVGMVSLGGFMLCYAWLCRRLHWAPSLAAGWAVFLGGSLLFNELPLDLAAASIVGLAVPLLGPRLFPAVHDPFPRRPLPRSELALRMGAAGVLVLAVTGAAAATGPQLAGLLTPVPVATSVIAAFSHRLGGPGAAILLLRGMMTGLGGFAVFFIVAGLTVAGQGIAVAAALGLVASLAAQGLTAWLLFRIKWGVK